MLSMHTSPLIQPGSGDGGGMNVYVREVASALGHAGVHCTTFTRADRPGLPAIVEVEPNHTVVHIPAGPVDLAKQQLPEVVDEFADRTAEWITAAGGVDVVHANYWLSGVAGHRIKHELDVPLVSTFHTLARVKSEGGDPEPEWRARAEADVIACSDAICVSCPEEERQFLRLYGAPNGRVEVVAPAVEHAFFAPGDQTGARLAADLPLGPPVVLFVGRIQALKSPSLAVAALAASRHRDAQLVIVGGASGIDGADELARVRALSAELDVAERVRLVEPMPHHLLSSFYRAADVVIVPSRSESFGLVALEAAACGTPVVASAVGGLLNIVEDQVTGSTVADRSPAAFAAAIDALLDDPARRRAMGAAAAALARNYTWSFTAARLRRVYADLTSTLSPNLVTCR